MTSSQVKCKPEGSPEAAIMNGPEVTASPPHNGDGRSTTVTPGGTPFPHSDAPNPDTSAPPAENTTEGMTSLASHSRELIKVIQKLETMGIDTTLPSLPKFIVIGDQSAGKSSIIEAACEVSLPRNQGTCTRCPFLITTTAKHSNGWSCKVSLQKRYMYTGSLRAKRNSNELWKSQDLEIFEFGTTNNRASLEDLLRRAQAAILNPQKQPEIYLHEPLSDEDHGVGFSPNVVAIDIEGDHLPELSFYDLPGAINVAPGQDEQHLVLVVQELIQSYLEDKKALILLACAANQDVENSTAFRFLLEAKATGRCMGVLTKPDLMERDRAERMQFILEGQKFTLGDSWYVTKQLSQEELVAGSISYTEARQREAAFFASEQPWSTSLAMFKDRFGIPHLQAAISRKLREHILAEIPEIHERVLDRLKKVNGRLSQFPAAPKYPSVEVHRVINDVYDALKDCIDGNGTQNDFRLAYTKIFKELQQSLTDAKPDLNVKTPGYNAQAFQTVSEDEDSLAQTPTPAPPSSKRRRANNGRPTATPSTPAVRASPSKGRQMFTLEEVKEKYDRGNISTMPNQLNSKVTEALALQTLKDVPELIRHALSSVRVLGTQMVLQSVSRAVASRDSTKLFFEASKCSKLFFEGIMHEQELAITRLLDCEMSKAITYQNTDDNNIREELLSRRLKQRLDEYLDPMDLNGMDVPRGEQRRKRLQDTKWIHENLGEDSCGKWIGAVIQVMKYYHIASARILDNVCIVLDRGMLRTLLTGIREKLLEDLNAYDNDYCSELLADDPERERERVRLLSEKSKLEQALNELQKLSPV